MSHQPHPQQPGWGPPQQPSWGTPPPRPPKKKNPAAVVGLGCLGAFALFIIIGTLASMIGEDTSGKDGKPKAKAPAYEVVQQEKHGNKRTVVVEVDTTKNLRAVFDAVTEKLTDEAGYYVMINCSTGGTKDLDNRLANGQKAVGNMGAATTGLEEGGTEFSTNEGRSCPDKTR
ncbi:hypothetical protein PV518_39820 [Streptomyces sp. ND04-05B]|uniref:hypothetical protein n=1 Tax=Streptomyces sp. ND04-05B TaxID=3028693 RepID=UPI0029AC3F31|nr:hypothetical protein [Streptomyces sp. ND04-05B]MDX3068241.1 hypothetical protein [Streptomyces sp. ND04-05B]